MKTVIRDAEPTDYSFIMSTWLRGQYYGNTHYRSMDKDAFFTAWHMKVSIILSNHVSAKVMCLDEDPDTIIGYAVYNDNMLHWVFVKRPFRKFGFAKELVPTGIDIVTSMTKMGKICMPESWTFNPFLIDTRV